QACRERQADEPVASLCERALTLAEQSQPPLHPEVAETVYCLAHHHWRQHQIPQALSLYQHALTLHEQLLGAHHPKTRKTREAFFDLLAQIEQVKESVTLYHQGPECALLCACGCGRAIDTSKSRGEPRRFFSTACRQRFYRNASRRKRDAGSVTFCYKRSVLSYETSADVGALEQRIRESNDPDGCVEQQ
ncbi:MAG TPA: tetratricopeptide repeat protein, partial [Ktedonobacteraceae bacterium]